METVISSELRKVRRFGGIARGLCIAFGIYCVVVLLFLVGVIAFGGQGPFNFGALSVRGDQFTPFLMAWAAFSLVCLLVPGFMGLRHMYLLFDNLREGRIYTQENVRHLRMLGVLGIVLPVIVGALEVASLLISKAGLAPTVVVNKGVLIFGPTSLGVFIWPSLLLLASWIMENGRKLQDEAERMRRESELTI